MRKRALTVLVALSFATALVVAEGGASSARVMATNRHAASVEAGQLLADVALPADATVVPREPAGDAHQLAVPLIGAFFAAEVDRRAFWTTSASPASVVASFRAHLPAGAKLVSSESSAGSAGAVYALGTRRRFVVGPEQVMLSAVVLSDGQTGVRADAQVRYLSPRPASERVPTSVRLVEITQTNIGGKPLVSLVVTRHSLVRKLARLVDGLPFVGKTTGVFSCPSFGALIDTFSFRATPAGPPLATVSESAFTPTFPSPCALTELTVRGHRLTPLLEGGILLKRASRLLGVRLTA